MKLDIQNRNDKPCKLKELPFTTYEVLWDNVAQQFRIDTIQYKFEYYSRRMVESYLVTPTRVLYFIDNNTPLLCTVSSPEDKLALVEKHVLELITYSQIDKEFVFKQQLSDKDSEFYSKESILEAFEVDSDKFDYHTTTHSYVKARELKLAESKSF